MIKIKPAESVDRYFVDIGDLSVEMTREELYKLGLTASCVPGRGRISWVQLQNLSCNITYEYPVVAYRPPDSFSFDVVLELCNRKFKRTGNLSRCTGWIKINRRTECFSVTTAKKSGAVEVTDDELKEILG